MSPKAKKLARKLLRENRGTRSKPGRPWRQIAEEDYGNKFNHAVLYRIAATGGAWLPKDATILTALGLRRARKAQTEKTFTPIAEMSVSALRKALRERKEIPPVIPAFIKEFKRLGWITRTRIR